MYIYVFSSTNHANIVAGVAARKWAVSRDQANMPGAATKASNLRVGTIGLFYCVETKSFTVPFLVTSAPQLDASITDIWPDEWFFPFSILPLGSPDKQFSSKEAAKLPVVKASGRTWNKVLRPQGQFVFQPAQIGSDDWEMIFTALKAD